MPLLSIKYYKKSRNRKAPTLNWQRLYIIALTQVYLIISIKSVASFLTFGNLAFQSLAASE